MPALKLSDIIQKWSFSFQYKNDVTLMLDFKRISFL